VNRLLLALVAFAVLAGLAWTTLSDERIRLVTLAILGLFALKTWLRRKDYLPARREDDSERS
jgi:hypothetical protein